MDELDQRITAWHAISGHPYFAPAFKEQGTLLDAMLAMLDKEPEEPIQGSDERTFRAFGAGYAEGLLRAKKGGVDL